MERACSKGSLGHERGEDTTHDLLCDVMGGDKYIDPAQPCSLPGHEGIYLYGLQEAKQSLRVRRCKFLVDGEHDGIMACCASCGEFDGQSTLNFDSLRSFCLHEATPAPMGVLDVS